MDFNSLIVSSPTEHVRESSQQQHKCDQCSSWQAENTRNLIVCIDGTSNEFGQNHTNVLKLFSKINLNLTCPEQYAYYIGGIGTGPKSSHTFSHIGRSLFDKLDMAVGWNVDKIIKEAYRWLAEMYRAGDQIYLFGFSRGAYQARVLAAMIYEVGLTTTSMQKQINRAYARYRAICCGKPEARDTARKFKQLFSWECLLRVHFVGVWDTVGFARGNHTLSASSSASHACHFRHALALDERRVKFMPEYFIEINARENHEMSRCIDTSNDAQYVTSHAKWRRSTVSNDGTELSSELKSSIKEVWFAGSHSDVGGVDRNRRAYNSGNVSLSWMRREAEASSLVLQPADTVWVPSDLDLSVSDSMTRAWKILECLPIIHQVSFSGAGVDSQRWHRLQPRRIIPGQKIHASILYPSTYKPRASLGEGFEIPTVHPGFDAKLDSQLWEIGMFDAAAAKEIMTCLGDRQGVAPIYLDKLLFILRFQEGKQCVRNVHDWQNQFLRLIQNPDCTPLVKLITIVAYYEASLDPPHVQPEILHFAKQSFSAVLAVHKHRDLLRVLSLMRPLTKHQILREHILTQDVLEAFVELLDTIIHHTGENVYQAMNGMTCLLQCEDTRGVIVEKLSANLPSSNVIRLSQILKVTDPCLLTAVLRMMITLARIPEGRTLCLKMRPRLMELAKTDEQLVGVLSVEILLVICDSSEQEPRSIRDANVRANVAGALIRLSPDRRDSADGEERDFYPGLRHLFGVDDTELTDRHKRLIKKLKSDIQQGNVRRRTIATLAVLNLCETEIIRTFLCEIDLLDVFISQTKRRSSALLAAYALSVCLKHDDMKKSMQNNRLLPKNIVNMFRLDYFDDGIGQIKGFQIFKDFMGDSVLRQRIKEHNIIEVLNAKLVKGKPKETRTGLICLDILCAPGGDDLFLADLVAKSLDCLRSSVWKAQNAGISILCALVQTERGVATIRPRICDIINMLLPDKVISSTTLGTTTTEYSDTEERTPIIHAAVDFWLPRSQMIGPARALFALAQNEMLRKATRATNEFSTLKYLYLSGVYMDEMKTLWCGDSLNHAVIDVLGKLIKRIDEAY